MPLKPRVLPELLDASHIIADRDARGEATVSNGLSLCKIHHAAFDRNLIGVRRDGLIIVRRDILDEQDGPMLQHGLKGLHRIELNALGIVTYSEEEAEKVRARVDERGLDLDVHVRPNWYFQ